MTGNSIISELNLFSEGNHPWMIRFPISDTHVEFRGHYKPRWHFWECLGFNMFKGVLYCIPKRQIQPLGKNSTEKKWSQNGITAFMEKTAMLQRFRVELWVLHITILYCVSLTEYKSNNQCMALWLYPGLSKIPALTGGPESDIIIRRKCTISLKKASSSSTF